MSEKSIKRGDGPPNTAAHQPSPPNPGLAPKPNPNSTPKPPVPAGLTRCLKCGHFKGDCIQDGEPWTITCRCKLNICTRCKTPVYEYRIGSNMYDERTGKCWHILVMCAWGHKCPDGVLGQLKNSLLLNLRNGEDLLKPMKELQRAKEKLAREIERRDKGQH